MKYFLILLFPLFSFSQVNFEITSNGFISSVIITDKNADSTYINAKEYIIKNCDELGNCIISEIPGKYLKFQAFDRLKYCWKNVIKYCDEKIIITEIELEFKENKVRATVLKITEFNIDYDLGLFLLSKKEVISENGYDVTSKYFYNKKGNLKKLLNIEPYKEAIENSINNLLNVMFSRTKKDDW